MTCVYFPILLFVQNRWSFISLHLLFPVWRQRIGYSSSVVRNQYVYTFYFVDCSFARFVVKFRNTSPDLEYAAFVAKGFEILNLQMVYFQCAHKICTRCSRMLLQIQMAIVSVLLQHYTTTSGEIKMKFSLLYKNYVLGCCLCSYLSLLSEWERQGWENNHSSYMYSK